MKRFPTTEDETSHKKIKIVINGLEGAGKTTILKHVKSGEVVSSEPTHGCGIETVDDGTVQMTAWDIGGENRVNPIWKQYYNDMDCYVFVVDSCYKERLGEAKVELYSHLMHEKEFENCIIAIVCNKQDLRYAAKVEDISEIFEIDNVKKKHQCEIFGTNAVTGEGLSDVIDWLFKQIKHNTNSNKKHVQGRSNGTVNRTVSRYVTKRTSTVAKLKHFIKSILMA